MQTYTRKRAAGPGKAPPARPRDDSSPSAAIPNSSLLGEIEGLERTPVSLTAAMNARMTERFGAPLTGLRVFEDSGLREMGQRGYARGNEIHLAEGELGRGGDEVLMHEAGHVVQQGIGSARGSGILHNTGLEMQADAGFSAPPGFTMPAGGDGPIQGFDWFWRKRRAAQEAARQKKARKTARREGFKNALSDAEFGARDHVGLSEITDIDDAEAFAAESDAEDARVSEVEGSRAAEGHNRIDEMRRSGKITPYQAFIKHKIYDHSHAIAQNARALKRYSDNPQRAARDFDKIKTAAKNIHDHAVDMNIEWDKAAPEFESVAIGGTDGAQSEKNQQLVDRQTAVAQITLADLYSTIDPALARQLPAECISYMKNALVRIGKAKLEREDAIQSAMTSRHDVSEGGEEHPVVPTTDEGFAEDGAAFFDLHAQNDAEADALIDAADGYLFKEVDSNGVIHMKATVPEFATSSPEETFGKGAGRKFEFRRNLNRFTRFVAGAIVDENGELKADAYEFYEKIDEIRGSSVSGDFTYGHESDDDIQTFKNLLGDFFTPDMYEGESEDDAIRSFLLFFKSNALTAEALGAIGGFIQNLQELTEPRGARIDKIERKFAGKTDPVSQSEKAQQIEAVNTAYANAETAKAEMAKARTQGLDSKDVFLINACSANAGMTVAAHGGSAASRAEYTTRASADDGDNLANYKARLKELCAEAREAVLKKDNDGNIVKDADGQPLVASIPGSTAELPSDDAIQQMSPGEIYHMIEKTFDLIKYVYHQAGVAHSSEHGTITTETFAAETSEYMVSPFIQSKKAVGIYRPNRGDTSSFQRYYNRDDPLPAHIDQIRKIRALGTVKPHT